MTREVRYTMLHKDWSLIANSILIQLAAGLVAFGAFYRSGFFNRAGGDTIFMAAAGGWIWAGPIIICAMILSLFHLGQPLRAYRAVTRIGSSWLSREVFFTGAFLLLWATSVAMDKSGQASMIWIWLTVAAGVLSVWSMSGIYAKTGRPGWKGMHPYLSFFGTFLIFGGIGSSLLLSAAGLSHSIAPAFPVLALLILIIRLWYAFRLFSILQGGAPQRSLDRLVAAAPVPVGKSLFRLHRLFTLWGWCVSFAGVTLSLYAATTLNTYAGVGLWIVIATLVLIGELLQRVGFNALGLDRETSMQARHFRSPHP